MLETLAQPSFVLHAVSELDYITRLHPSSILSHRQTLHALICAYSTLSLLDPKNLILSLFLFGFFISLFQALPKQSQHLIRFFLLTFSASLLVDLLSLSIRRHSSTVLFLAPYQCSACVTAFSLKFFSPFWPCLCTALHLKNFILIEQR